MKHNQCAWIEHLVNSGAIVLILHSDTVLINSVLGGFQGIANFGGEAHLEVVVHIVQVNLFVLVEELLLLLMSELVRLLLIELLQGKVVFIVILRATARGGMQVLDNSGGSISNGYLLGGFLSW